MESSHLKPYDGTKPYVFVSYSHKDSEKAFYIMNLMKAAGVLLWFDKGIDPGSEWDDNIATHLENCGCLVAILSRNYLASENCRDELKYARDLKKDILVIYIESCELPGGIALRMNRRQAINMYTYEDQGEFHQELIHAKVLAPYIHINVEPPASKESKAGNETKETVLDTQSYTDEGEFQIGHLTDYQQSALGLSQAQLIGKTLIYAQDNSRTDAFLYNLIINLYQQGISFLIISSEKKSYRSLLNDVPDLQYFTPGKPEVVPFPYNPFVTGERSYQKKITSPWFSRVGHCLQNTMSLSPLAFTVFMQALRKCFTEGRFTMEHSNTSNESKGFQLRDVIYRYRQLVHYGEYTSEEKESLLSECDDKIQSILEETEDVLDQTSMVEAERLLDVPSVIEMNGIDSPEIKSFLLQLILNRIFVCGREETVLGTPPKARMRQIILIDDIDSLFAASEITESEISRQVASLRLLKELEMLHQIGLIGVTNNPTSFGPKVLQSFHTKVILPQAEPIDHSIIDYLFNDNAHNTYPDPEESILLKKGEGNPMVFTPDYWEDTKVSLLSDQDIISRVWYWLDKDDYLLRYRECWDCKYCEKRCNSSVLKKADRIASRLYYRDSRKIHTETDLEKNFAELNPGLWPELKSLLPVEKLRLFSCTSIRLYKEYYMKKGLELNPEIYLPSQIPFSIFQDPDHAYSLNYFPVGYNPKQDDPIVYFGFDTHLFYKIEYKSSNSIKDLALVENLLLLFSKAEHTDITVLDEAHLLFQRTPIPENIRLEITDNLETSFSEHAVNWIRSLESYREDEKALSSEPSFHLVVLVLPDTWSGMKSLDESFLNKELKDMKSLKKTFGNDVPDFPEKTYYIICSKKSYFHYRLSSDRTICLNADGPEDIPFTEIRTYGKFLPNGAVSDKDGQLKPFILFQP